MKTTHQATILRSFVKPTPKPYTPHFRVAREPNGWRLFDGANAIGFVGDPDWFFFDLWY